MTPQSDLFCRQRWGLSQALAIASLCACSLTQNLASAQSATTNAPPSPITVRAGAPLAQVLSQLQHALLSPISYEDVPFENAADVASPAVRASGTPDIALTVTFGGTDNTPYNATQTALQAYKNAGLPGTYNIVQNSGWVSVVPTQVTGSDGGAKAVVPLMSRLVTFPSATRKGNDTLQLIVDAIAQESGANVILLNTPFWLGGSETVTVGASGEPAGEVIQSVAKSFNRPMSYQCLYVPSLKTYYLNVTIVAADNPPGVAGPQAPPLAPGPRVGPTTNRWFDKKL
jgi:hypothetical protein